MVVVIASIHISEEIFEIDVLTALKSSLEHRRKHLLRLLQLYGDQYLPDREAGLTNFQNISQKISRIKFVCITPEVYVQSC